MVISGRGAEQASHDMLIRAISWKMLCPKKRKFGAPTCTADVMTRFISSAVH